MKKKIVVMIMAFIFSVCFCSTTLADTLTVTNDYANCRSKPGAANTYMGKVYKGETYEILGSGIASNGRLWYLIDVKGTKTYICSSFVKIANRPISGHSKGISDDSKFKLSEADKRYIASVVSAEARGESLKGQKAVAQVIYDRAVKGGQSPVSVVKAPNQFASPWGGGKYTDSCYKAVVAIFDNGERVTKEKIFYFYDWHMIGKPKFLNGHRMITEIGCHRFYS